MMIALGRVEFGRMLFSLAQEHDDLRLRRIFNGNFQLCSHGHFILPEGPPATNANPAGRLTGPQPGATSAPTLNYTPRPLRVSYREPPPRNFQQEVGHFHI